MIKKYKGIRTVGNVKALQLKENNIMEMARFLNSNDFWSFTDNVERIAGVAFTIIELRGMEDEVEWDSDIEFGSYAVNADNDYEIYSEKDFKQLFTEEK